MEAAELYRAGRLDEAIAAQIAAVKAAPTDADRRYFLFGLLAFTGDWERARPPARRPGHPGSGDPGGQRGLPVAARRGAGAAGGLGAGARAPDAARPAGAPARAPGPGGRARDGGSRRCGSGAGGRGGSCAHAARRDQRRPLRALRDQDDVLGSVLEVFAGGRCLWLPLEHLRSATCARAPASAGSDLAAGCGWSMPRGDGKRAPARALRGSGAPPMTRCGWAAAPIGWTRVSPSGAAWASAC